MKNFLKLSYVFVMLMLSVLFTSCKDKHNEVKPEVKTEYIDNLDLKGTTWRRVDSYVGKDTVYSVADFTADFVQISYRWKKEQLYTNVGVFKYTVKNNLLEIINPNDSLNISTIKNNTFILGGLEYKRYK